MLEQRRTGKTDEGRIRQRQPHVARQLAGLGAVRLVRHHDDVVSSAVRFVRRHLLIELVNQAEHIAVILLQQLLQRLARTRARRLVVRHPAAHKGLVNLAVQIIPVSHQHKGEVTHHGAPHLLGKESHGIRLAAALRVPHHTQTTQIGVRALHNLKVLRRWFCRHGVSRQRLIGREVKARHGQLNRAMH